MKLFNKNNWLNFLIGLFGFYFFYTLLNNVFGVFKVTVASKINVSVSYYWILVFCVSFILTTFLIYLFCKPRSPLAMAVAIFCSGILSMYHPLYLSIINLDYHFMQEGINAIIYLLPHFLIILATLIIYLIGLLSNTEKAKEAKGN